MEPNNTNTGGGNMGKVVWVIVILVVVIGGIWIAKSRGTSSSSTPTPTPTPASTVDLNPKSGEVVVTGKLDCLPLVSGKVPTADQCIVGLKGDDNKIYGLDTSKVEEFEKGITVSSNVKITGVSITKDPASEEAKIYKYDAVMSARLIQSKS